jgi:hypothetical protein
MTDIQYRDGAFALLFDGSELSSHPTYKVAKRLERRFLKLLSLGASRR